MAVTRTLTNVTNSFLPLSTADAGNVHRAVYGKEWSVKYTPTENYAFTTFTILVNGIDKTSELATLNADGTYTITLTAHFGDTISVTAIAE